MRAPCQTFFLTFSQWFYLAEGGGRQGEPNEDAFEVYTSFGGPGGLFTHQKSKLNVAEVVLYWLAVTRHVRDMDGDGCADLMAIRYDDDGTAKFTVYLAKGDCTRRFAPPQIEIRKNGGNLEFGAPLVLGAAPPTMKQWLLGSASQ